MKRMRILALSVAFLSLSPRAASAQSGEAPPLRPARRPAHLEINSHLPGADIFVDGQPVGTTPAAASFAVSRGVHTIELRLRRRRHGTALVINAVRDEVGWPLVGLGAAGMVLGIAFFVAADDPHRYDDRSEARSAACGSLRARPVFWPGGGALVGAF